ncbi:hypothetical protein I3F58_06985 [Streptomyces sp. MUM 203J]|uniref:hypothetical protein n=1 Tax=Streptomyces sp. MUM 203J TaxID=2791990 RepID=UPI001F0430AB|nr:hypothetical protein [Streptomyces sp. MUM 203J]MCH0539308.1 hypothetical protein [Streptomyces sp. MUM 203J]
MLKTHTVKKGKSVTRMAVLAPLVLAPALVATPAGAVGTASEGTAVTMGARALCSGTATALPYKWSKTSKSCSYTSPARNWRGYIMVDWSVQGGTNQSACVQGRMSSARNPKPKWQSIGCGKNGKGKVSWPANTASMLEIRVKSMNPVHIANVRYSI